MTPPSQNTGFACANCCALIHPLTNGSYRNHCPYCLYSVHLDVHPGDRLSDCKGLMKPLHLVYKSGKGLQIQHVCLSCGAKKVCRVATDTIQPDDINSLAALG